MPRAFLLMPFKSEFDDLRRLIVEAGKAVGVEVVRADDIFAGGTIIDQVKDRILQADAVIALCTERNPNVFFELGLADAGHRPILVAKESGDLPFDIRHWRAHFYGGTELSASLSTLGERIQKALTETLAEPRSLAPLAGPNLAQRLVALRARLTERARGLLGAMASYAPGDLAQFGEQLEPLLIDYFVGLAGLIRADDMETFDHECRDFARWTEIGLGPPDGYSAWAEMPQWLVWWTASACGMFAVFTERWGAIRVLHEHSVPSVVTGKYRPLPHIDAGAGGDGIGQARFQTHTERWIAGQDAAATALVRTLAASTPVRQVLGDFAASEEHLATLLAVYRYVSVLKVAETGKEAREWPWVPTIPRLDNFIRRVNQDGAYRQRLAERLFGRSVERFEAEAPGWEKVVLPPQAWPKPRSMGPFT